MLRDLVDRKLAELQGLGRHDTSLLAGVRGLYVLLKSVPQVSPPPFAYQAAVFDQTIERIAEGAVRARSFEEIGSLSRKGSSQRASTPVLIEDLMAVGPSQTKTVGKPGRRGMLLLAEQVIDEKTEEMLRKYHVADFEPGSLCGRLVRLYRRPLPTHKELMAIGPSQVETFSKLGRRNMLLAVEKVFGEKTLEKVVRQYHVAVLAQGRLCGRCVRLYLKPLWTNKDPACPGCYMRARQAKRMRKKWFTSETTRRKCEKCLQYALPRIAPSHKPKGHRVRPRSLDADNGYGALVDELAAEVPGVNRIPQLKKPEELTKLRALRGDPCALKRYARVLGITVPEVQAQFESILENGSPEGSQPVTPKAPPRSRR